MREVPDCLLLGVPRKVDESKPSGEYQNCPLRCSDTSFQPIHRFAKQELLQQKFSCPYVDSEDEEHGAPLPYAQALEHLQTCQYRAVTCQCGLKIKFKDVTAHLQKCTKARVYCRNCEVSYNYKKEQHNCLEFLRTQYKKLKSSKAKVEQYESGIAAKCPNGHALYPHRGKTHWQY